MKTGGAPRGADSRSYSRALSRVHTNEDDVSGSSSNNNNFALTRDRNRKNSNSSLTEAPPKPAWLESAERYTHEPTSEVKRRSSVAIANRRSSSKQIAAPGERGLKVGERPESVDAVKLQHIAESMVEAISNETEDSYDERSPMTRNERLAKLETDPERFFAENPRIVPKWNELLWNVMRTAAPQEAAARVRALGESMRANDLLDFNPRTYAVMMQAYARSASSDPAVADAALALVDEMKEVGVTRTIHCYGSLTDALVAAGRLDDAFKVLDMVRAEQLVPSVVLYTTLIKGCYRAGALERAWSTYYAMRDADIQPDVLTYQAMMMVCARERKAELAMNMLTEMRHLGMQPTGPIYDAIIFACAQRSDLFSEAFEHYDRMVANEFSPSARTYTALLSACARLGKIDTAHQMMVHMTEFGVPKQLRHYNQMLSTIGASQRVHEVKDMQDEPSMSRNRRIELAEEVYVEIARLTARGQVPVDSPGESARVGEVTHAVAPDTVTKNALLSVYTRAFAVRRAEARFRQLFPSDADAFVGAERDRNHAEREGEEGEATKELVASETSGSSRNRWEIGRERDAAKEAALVAAVSSEPGGERVLASMRDTQSADQYSAFLLLLMYCDTQRAEPALRVWKSMRARKWCPGLIGYRMLIKCLGHAERREEAEEVWHAMRAAGFAVREMDSIRAFGRMPRWAALRKGIPAVLTHAEVEKKRRSQRYKGTVQP